jgi:hypothetical protein
MTAAILALALLAAPPGSAKPAHAKAKTHAGTVAPAAASDSLAASRPASVLSFEPLTIEGRVRKPAAIYQLQRNAPAFGELAPEESFTKKIYESVEADPF